MHLSRDDVDMAALMLNAGGDERLIAVTLRASKVALAAAMPRIRSLAAFYARLDRRREELIQRMEQLRARLPAADIDLSHRLHRSTGPPQ
ncbi:hypothetical protein [Labrys wisconsinensis]|uniref:Uncharacterized protein n=1 Tax=Labrys wisconsinensis TaxID=425677 RepID=A0ABU0JET3_9HYPH|nr:hypothetical protein [Labrys wisconsinensis]MDQ0472790.1 hypothetical protein [Labrys wisconsinensis]